MILEASQLQHILVVGPLAYLLIVVLLRVSGKRTLSKMNAFDFIVTVALGSMLATIILNDDISLLEGAVALSILIVGQLVLTYLSARSRFVTKLIKAKPTLVYHQGEFYPQVLDRERVTREEVLAAARASGHPSLDTVFSVVLESDGTFSVLTTGESSTSPEMPYVR